MSSLITCMDDNYSMLSKTTEQQEQCFPTLSQHYPNTIPTLFQHYPKNLSYPHNEQKLISYEKMVWYCNTVIIKWIITDLSVFVYA